MPYKEGGGNQSQPYDENTGRYTTFSNFAKPRDYDSEIKELQAEKRKYSMFSKEGQEIRQKIMDLIAQRDGYKSDADKKEQVHKKAEEREKALEEYKKKQEKQQKESYMMSHRPTESGVTADNLTNQNAETPAPEDLYEHPQYYMNLNNQYDSESWEALKKVRNKPNATITIYRATIGDKINDGDWITLSPTYAKEHNLHSLDGKGKILKMDVPVQDIQWSMDSINEWGYFPNKFENGLKRGLNLK